MIVKMIKMPDPNVVDPFVCESIDAVEEDDFDLVKGTLYSRYSMVFDLENELK